MNRINERPGVVVVTIGKNGTVIRYDPGLFARTIREQSARDKKKEVEEGDDG